MCRVIILVIVIGIGNSDISFNENFNECSQISGEYCTGSEDESTYPERGARGSPRGTQSGSKGVAEADVSASGPGAAGESSQRCSAGSVLQQRSAGEGLQSGLAGEGLQPEFAEEGLHSSSAGEGLQPGLAGEGLQPGLVSEGSLSGSRVLRNRRNIVKPQRYNDYDLELIFFS